VAEELQIKTSGDAALPTLVYLPGLHGDWTLVTAFRIALSGRARFVEIMYPRSLTWQIPDYASAIMAALEVRGITTAWLIGESFGSQIAWQLAGNRSGTCKFQGLILAGGFVKYPIKRGPAALRWLGGFNSAKTFVSKLWIITWHARLRQRHLPEAVASLREFMARRTKLDREAMRQRLCLLDDYDPRGIARELKLPVYFIGGFVDALVPWPLVLLWLRKNCPGYRGSKIFWFADHVVLATAPTRSAELILEWMRHEAQAKPPV
jgi:pimeloyl-ACP methyl ester carboxylesterase